MLVWKERKALPQHCIIRKKTTSFMSRNELSLTANEPGQLQMMLDRLSANALRKGLIVNTSKSEVVHFNS